MLISLLQSLSAVILEPKKIKFVTASTVSHICHEVMGLDAKDLKLFFFFFFFMLSFKPTFSFIYFGHRRSSLVPLHFLPLEWYHLHI